MNKALHNKKILIFGLAIGLLAGISIGWIMVGSSGNKTTYSLPDAEIKTKLGCGRATLDYRETDVFCNNPSLYRQLLNNGVVLDETSSSPKVKLVLVTPNKKAVRLLSNAEVKLKAAEAVVCIKAPCPRILQTIWTGTTNNLGIVEIPRDIIEPGTTVMSNQLSGDLHSISPTKAAYIIQMYDPATS